MKKLVIAAMALALSAGVNANESGPRAGGTGVAGVGGLTVATLTAMGISAAIAATIISNSKGVTIDPGQQFELACDAGDGTPNAGVCTNTTVTNTQTVTGTGTATSTMTITVPVTSTYPATLRPVN